MFLFYHCYAARSTSVQTLFTPKSISAHAVILSEPILDVNAIPVKLILAVPVIVTQPIPLVNCCPVTPTICCGISAGVPRPKVIA